MQKVNSAVINFRGWEINLNKKTKVYFARHLSHGIIFTSENSESLINFIADYFI